MRLDTVTVVHHVPSIRAILNPRDLDSVMPVCILPLRHSPRFSMRLARFAPQFFFGLAAMTAFLAPTSASARTPYDGKWSVLILTKNGPCDAAYRYGLSVRDGQVFYEGSASVNVSGRVGRNGAVSVRVSAGSQGANGSGRLGKSTGSGNWKGVGSMGTCAGVWSAERRS
jgi:hypothetical protein